MNVEEDDVVVRATVGEIHFDSIGPSVLAQDEKLCGMPDGTGWLKYGVLQPYVCLTWKNNKQIING